MNRFNQLHWPLIIGMGALALIRPFMNIIGLMDALGRPTGQILVTLLISAIWLAIVVLNRVERPVLTLVLTGMVYGLFALVLGAILSPILTGQLSGPLANPFILPFALVSILVTNGIWGLIVGVLAWAIGQIGQPQKQSPSS